MEQGLEVMKFEPKEVSVILDKDNIGAFEERLKFVRDDIKDNPYLKEAIKVLPVGGFRSAIICFWNALVDDLRNKIMYRSLSLFNKEMSFKKEIKSYEDFQDYVNDDKLIEGAFKIGVIGWEAKNVLKHARETRNIFSGHPCSSDPSPIKVLSMMEDCIKYVLSQEYPTQIIDIDEYISNLSGSNFDRDEFRVANALSDLPENYKKELINKLFTAYIDLSCPSTTRSNIEFIAPILWIVLNKNDRIQIVRRVDQEIIKGNAMIINFSISFVDVVKGTKYLSLNAKTCIIKPLVTELNKSLDDWANENKYVKELEKYAGVIPIELIYDYVNGLTQTYIGHIGGSYYYDRTNFFANEAASRIPKMFEKFDDECAEQFITAIKNNKTIKSRIRNSVKMRRLRSLGNIVLSKVSEKFQEKNILEMMVDEQREDEFFNLIR